jgi:hypothetical protein
MPKFAIEGKEYEWTEALTIKEALEIQDKAMVGGADLFPALDRRDPRAVAAFMLVLKKRAREAVTWNDMLQLNLMTFQFIPDEEPEGEVEEVDEKPDPTSNAGKTRKGGTKSTG